MHYAVIMAGGAGTRLWPLSRAGRPKQLLRLFEGKSLLRHAFERLRAVFDPERIFIITVAAHLEAVAEDLPELPADNLIGEPVGRDTANAIGLATAILRKNDPDAVVGIFTADHIIRPVEVFADCIRRGYAAAEADAEALVTFGIKPTFPHTGLGYIQRGGELADGLYRVEQFKEKPDLATAREYVDSGRYYWNSGMFVWRAETVLAELRRHLPDSYEKLSRIAADWPSPRGKELADELYPTLQKISIDYAVMEKAAKVLVVEMPCEWQDVGSFIALESLYEADQHGNIAAAAAKFIEIDATGNIVVSEDEHLIAAIGVEDLIIVRTPDATLICRKADAQRIRNMAERLATEFDGKYA